MSFNIYEDPDRNMKVRCSKGLRGKVQERVEKVVDIYESVETSTGPEVNACRKVRGARTRKRPQLVQRNPYKAAALILGLLCLLLLAGIGVQLYLFIRLKPDPPTCEVNNQNSTDWQEIRTSRLFYTSTEKKNWTESRKDCQRRGGDLVIINSKEKQDILRRMKLHGDSWIGLQSVNTGGWGAKAKWKWQWVDGSELEYKSWKNGVSTTAEAGSKAYIDQQFLWMHSKTELKHWICEKSNISHTGVIHT